MGGAAAGTVAGLTTALLFWAFPVGAETLTKRVESLASALSGPAGVYIGPVGGPPEAALAADELFPTASLVKVPILAAVLDRVERGELGYSAELVYRSTRAYPGEDMLASFQDGSTVTLSRLAFLSAKMSDNTASLWLQELAGGGAGVNAWLAANGYEKTRVNSRTPGREADRERYGWGQTTPRELARLMESIWTGACVSPAASAELARLLTGSFWDGEALSALPPTAAVISKQGAVDASRGEALVARAKTDFVLVALTRELKDRRWAADQEGFVFLRLVAAAAWERFGGGAVPRRGPFLKN